MIRELTHEENCVLWLAIRNVPTKAIAAQLNISPRSVDRRKQDAFHKLRVMCALDAALVGVAHGLAFVGETMPEAKPMPVDVVPEPSENAEPVAEPPVSHREKLRRARQERARQSLQRQREEAAARQERQAGDPTEEEIAALCEVIRVRWTQDDYRQRTRQRRASARSVTLPALDLADAG